MANKSLNLTQEMKEAIGKRLKDFRNSIGLSQIDVAVDVGITQTSVSNMETGKYLVTSETLLVLHNLYGLDPSYILTGKSANGIDESLENFVAWYKELGDDNPVKSGASHVCEGLMLSYSTDKNGGK